MNTSCTENVQILLQGSFNSSTITYSIVSHISEGVHGTVHVIKCPQFTGNNNKSVALKVFKKKRSNSVLNEVCVYKKILNHINHDFIMKAYAYVLELNYSLLYLEYIPNGTLKEYILSHQEIQPSTYQLVFTLAEVSEGLSMLHDIGIAHQDIKSDNILIRENGHLTICDFGTSSINDNPRGRFKRNTTWSSIHLAPEISDPSISYFDFSVDYYSLGVLICQMVDYYDIPDPLDTSHDYMCPSTFDFIPHTIRKTIAALMHPKSHSRLCNDNKGNVSLLLEPGMKSVIWPKLGQYLGVYEIKEKIRAMLLETPFK